jgi:hypothetical protein
MCDFTYRAFEIADTYRMAVFILSDAYIGQMMEPVSIPQKVLRGERKEWALYGDADSRENLLASILMNTTLLGEHNWKLQEKYKKVEEEIVDFEEIMTDDAEYLFIGYGISSRICISSMKELRDQGIKKISREVERLKHNSGLSFLVPEKLSFSLHYTCPKLYIYIYILLAPLYPAFSCRRIFSWSVSSRCGQRTGRMKERRPRASALSLCCTSIDPESHTQICRG